MYITHFQPHLSLLRGFHKRLSRNDLSWLIISSLVLVLIIILPVISIRVIVKSEILKGVLSTACMKTRETECSVWHNKDGTVWSFMSIIERTLSQYNLSYSTNGYILCNLNIVFTDKIVYIEILAIMYRISTCSDILLMWQQ